VAKLTLPPHEVFFGYSYASLEALEAEKDRGVFTIVDQIDPGPMEYRLVAEEMDKHPELAGPPAPFPTEHYARARREWEVADVIVVNSEWSRDAIIKEGADPAKVKVLPLAYEPGMDQSPKSKVQSRANDKAKLKVLWLGQVNVRKGIGYVLEAARLLEGEPVDFIVAGPLQIRKEVVANAPKNMRWMGPVPRNEASKLYAQSDVFVLPTLSDGFALTQLEALAHALPVVVTPNCGWVVEEAVTGFVIPPRDSMTLAKALLKFIRDRELAHEMVPACIKAATSFSVDDYGLGLVSVIQKRLPAARRQFPVLSGR
jgi:glycosyltransferase involved in cell wall biosynthesis